MGVSFYTCPICTYIFADCDDDITYCDHCNNIFCSDECAEMEHCEEEGGYEVAEDEESSNCCICRKEKASDYILFNFLLGHSNLTREQVLEMWQKRR